MKKGNRMSKLKKFFGSRFSKPYCPGTSIYVDDSEPKKKKGSIVDGKICKYVFSDYSFELDKNGNRTGKFELDKNGYLIEDANGIEGIDKKKYKIDPVSMDPNAQPKVNPKHNFMKGLPLVTLSPEERFQIQEMLERINKDVIADPEFKNKDMEVWLPILEFLEQDTAEIKKQKMDDITEQGKQKMINLVLHKLNTASDLDELVELCGENEFANSKDSNSFDCSKKYPRVFKKFLSIIKEYGGLEKVKSSLEKAIDEIKSGLGGDPEDDQLMKAKTGKRKSRCKRKHNRRKSHRKHFYGTKSDLFMLSTFGIGLLTLLCFVCGLVVFLLTVTAAVLLSG